MKNISLLIFSLLLALVAIAQDDQFNYYMNQGSKYDGKEAISYFDKALQIKPNDTTAIFNAYVENLQWANRTRKVDVALKAVQLINKYDSITGKTSYQNRGIAEMVYAYNYVSNSQPDFKKVGIVWYEKSIANFDLTAGDNGILDSDIKAYRQRSVEARDRLKYD